MTDPSKRALLCAVCPTLSLAILMCTSVARSQDAPLEAVVVTGSLENEILQILTQVATIEARTIKSGVYVDISQTLAAKAPGLFINSAHGPFDYVNVSLQGSRTEEQHAGRDLHWISVGSSH